MTGDQSYKSQTEIARGDKNFGQVLSFALIKPFEVSTPLSFWLVQADLPFLFGSDHRVGPVHRVRQRLRGADLRHLQVLAPLSDSSPVAFEADHLHPSSLQTSQSAARFYLFLPGELRLTRLLCWGCSLFFAAFPILYLPRSSGGAGVYHFSFNAGKLLACWL